MKQTVRSPRVVWISVAVVVLVIGAVLLAAWIGTRPTYVFSVNGVKIEREELIYAMGENRLTVAHEVEQRYAADSGDADFWDRRFDGETPNEMLRRTAAEAIIADKVQFLAAKEHGIDVLLSYSSLKAALDEENDKRASGGGEVHYGPQELSFHIFYVNRLMNAQTELKDALRPTVLSVSDQQIKAYFSEHSEDYVSETGEPQTLEEVKDLIRIVLEDERYDQYVQGLVDQASVVYYDAFDTVTQEDFLSE